MKILREYGIENKMDKYNLSNATGTNMSELIGQRIEVKAYLLVEDVDRNTGELKKALKVLTPDGDIIGTRSQSFIEGFETFLTFMETDEIHSMGVEQARSKAGRNYLTFRA